MTTSRRVVIVADDATRTEAAADLAAKHGITLTEYPEGACDDLRAYDATGARITAQLAAAAAQAAGITPRELDVLTHIADGLTFKEIGKRLALHPDTAKTTASRMYRKLGVVGVVGDRAQAVAVAFRRGILGGDR